MTKRVRVRGSSDSKKIEKINLRNNNNVELFKPCESIFAQKRLRAHLTLRKKVSLLITLTSIRFYTL